MSNTDIKQTIEDIDDGPICLRPAPGTCCPDNTRHIMCVGCGKDYGSYCEAIDRIREEELEKNLKLNQQYLGVLSFLGDNSVHLDEDSRETVEMIMSDAQALIPNLKVKRTLNRFDLSVDSLTEKQNV